MLTKKQLKTLRELAKSCGGTPSDARDSDEKVCMLMTLAELHQFAMKFAASAAPAAGPEAVDEPVGELVIGECTNGYSAPWQFRLFDGVQPRDGMQLYARAALATASTAADEFRQTAFQELYAFQELTGCDTADEYRAKCATAPTMSDAVRLSLTDRIIHAIEGECDGLAISAEQASSILAYLQYGATISETQSMQRDAERYRKLRAVDIDAIHKGGVFAGLTPDNVVINGEDLDIAVDLLIDRANAEGDPRPMTRDELDALPDWVRNAKPPKESE